MDRERLAYYRVFIEFKMLIVLLTGLRSFYATEERQLHYGSSVSTLLTREAQLRAMEELAGGGPCLSFDAYSRSRQRLSDNR